MGSETVRIYDTTLRDGLRNSGIAIALAGKVRFLRQLARLGVSDIEVGFGGPGQVDTMRRLATAVDGPILYGLARVNRRDLDRVLDALSGARCQGANIFSPTSEKFMEYAGKSGAGTLAASVRAVAHAKSRVDNVVFSAQDAANADRGFLIELLGAVVEAGATAISLADTTSQAQPAAFGDLCGDLRAGVPGGTALLWSVHCHDGSGLAVANCAAAIKNGVRQVECTVNGMGEANSNTDMGAVVKLLNDRAGAFSDLNCDVDLAAFGATVELLAEISEPTGDGHSDVVDLLRRGR